MSSPTTLLLELAGATTEAEVQAILDDVRDRSHELTPLGPDVIEYLNVKKKRLTPASYRNYEGSLALFAREHPLHRIANFEPPAGTVTLEAFLARWDAPASYNRNLSILTDFFKFAIIRGKLHGDPTIGIERAKKRDVHRTTFPSEDRRRIIAEQGDRRDRVALRLLLDYGIRKGALKAVQYRHFDHVRQRLTIFTKGGKVRDLPLPDPAFWHDLERLILDVGAEPHHYLMPGRRGNHHGVRLFPDRPMSDRGLHDWWYRRLEDAGIVPEGTRKGEKMHKARHTAGQRVLEATGNLKAVQALLGHESISTTADVYVDWGIDLLAGSLTETFRSEEDL